MKEKLWGGRFKEKLDSMILEFTKSIDYDFFLFEYQAQACLAWAKELTRLKIITSQEFQKTKEAIKQLLSEWDKENIKIDFEYEDIHSFFYGLLRNKIGDTVDKLHSGKSRNEEIVTIMRMFVKDAILDEIGLIEDLQKKIVEKAGQYKTMIIPGFTHLQYAQPLLFAHWLLSYVEQLQRDKYRLLNAYKHTDVLPAGCGAFGGSSLAINRENLRKALGFSQLGTNSVDIVSDRDFILEYLNCNVILSLHLSRLSEDLIIYNSPGYGFVEFSDKVTTGSSFMPHKKNPDPLELIRASSAEVISYYVFLSGVLKGLPTTYNRDLQLDKKSLWGSYIVISDVLRAMGLVIQELKLNLEKINDHLRDERLYLTDVCEYLVKKGIAWKQAHYRIGMLLRKSEKKKLKISQLNKNEVQKILGIDVD
ncbi:MAG TPA: argininosuccinate lyase, partial [Candidatus Omnitrophica bacterium]|nr:argininosuccinate lyase [Candidatus Omnitrophota bacterium]